MAELLTPEQEITQPMDGLGTSTFSRATRIGVRGGVLVDGKQAWARSHEKVDLAIAHLARWHFSNRYLLLRAIGVKVVRNDWFAKLCRAGIIGEYRYPTYGGWVVLLGPRGCAEAREKHLEMARYKAQPSRVHSDTLRHDLAVQAAIMDLEGVDHDSVEPARLIDSEVPKKPDATYKIAGSETTIAVEVQLSVMAQARFFQAFAYYTRAILKEQRFAQVRYLFREPKMMNHVRRLYDLPEWPRYVPVPNTNKWMLEKDNPIRKSDRPKVDGVPDENAPTFGEALEAAKAFSFELAPLRID